MDSKIVFSQGYNGALGALLVQLGAVCEPDIAFENNFVPPAWTAAITHGYPVLRHVADDGKSQESAGGPSAIDGPSPSGCALISIERTQLMYEYYGINTEFTHKTQIRYKQFSTDKSIVISY